MCFMNIQQECEPQLEHLVIYQVFAAISSSYFGLSFNYVWGWKIC